MNLDRARLELSAGGGGATPLQGLLWGLIAMPRFGFFLPDRGLTEDQDVERHHQPPRVPPFRTSRFFATLRESLVEDRQPLYSRPLQAFLLVVSKNRPLPRLPSSTYPGTFHAATSAAKSSTPFDTQLKFAKL